MTVPAAYGDFTLDKKPTRIVVIGVENVDLLNALGEKPVAFAAAGEADSAALNAGSPWIADLYSGDEYDPSLITSEYKVSLESVAEQNPDLIIGSSFYIEQAQYEQLSKLAPTYVKVASPERDWKADLTDLGTLLGMSDQATTALTDLDAEYAATRETLPGLQGRTINTGWYNEGGVRMPPAYSWVEDLGLKPAENQPAIGTPAVSLAAENLDQFAGDVAIISATDSERATLEGAFERNHAETRAVQTEQERPVATTRRSNTTPTGRPDHGINPHLVRPTGF